MAIRIWCGISGHGFGHFAQLSPILRHLQQWRPDLTLRIVGGPPAAVMTAHLGHTFIHDAPCRDVGLVQQGAMRVDLAATRDALRHLHDHWHDHLRAEEAAMAQWQPHLVLANIPYLTLAAAANLGIPTVAVASLTWDRVIAAYFGEEDGEVNGWLEHMKTAYGRADWALLPQPALGNPPFPRWQEIPPLTTPGRPNRRRLRQNLGLSPDDPRPIVLASFGGIPTEFSGVTAWKNQQEIIWLSNFSSRPVANNVFFLDDLTGWSHADITASVDAMVGKPGYGMAVEAVSYGIPFLYTRRGTFPDEEVICPWLHQHGRAMALNEEQLWSGDWSQALAQLWATPPPPPPATDGSRIAAQRVIDLLSTHHANTINL